MSGSSLDKVKNKHTITMTDAGFIVSMTDAGYPSNLSKEDQEFIIRRMTELSNKPNNPYLFGDSGMKMLLQEKNGKK